MVSDKGSIYLQEDDCLEDTRNVFSFTREELLASFQTGRMEDSKSTVLMCIMKYLFPMENICNGESWNKKSVYSRKVEEYKGRGAKDTPKQ